MKLKRNGIFPLILACLLATTGAPAQAVRTPAIASAPAPAQQDEPADALASLQKLALNIRDKLAAEKAQPAEQDYTLELAAFDAIITANKNAKPDDLAQVLAVKSSLYIQAFNDYDNAAKTIERIKTEFPRTEIGAHVDEMLADLKRMQAKYLAQQAMAPGKVFPDFTAKSLAGADVSLAQFKGKVVLVDFWATWCPPCVAEMPHLKAAYEKYHGKGFEIVGISLDQSESTLKDFVQKNSIPWIQICDGKGWESAFAEKCGVDVIPTMYLLDADGKIIGSNLGGMVLEEQLEKLLGK